MKTNEITTTTANNIPVVSTLEGLKTLVTAYNIAVADAVKNPVSENLLAITPAKQAMENYLADLNKNERIVFYRSDLVKNGETSEIMSTLIDLTAVSYKPVSKGSEYKYASLATKHEYVSLLELSHYKMGDTLEKSVQYAAKVFALLAVKELTTDKIDDMKELSALVTKKFAGAYLGEDTPKIDVSTVSATKISKAVVSPMLEKIGVNCIINNKDIRYIASGMVSPIINKAGERDGEYRVSNIATFDRLLAAVVYCKLNNISYTAAA